MKKGIVVVLSLVAMLVFAGVVAATERTGIILDPLEEEGERIMWAYEP